MCLEEFNVQVSCNRDVAQEVKWLRRGCLVVIPKIGTGDNRLERELFLRQEVLWMQVFVTKTKMLCWDSPNSHATSCVLLKAIFPRLQLRHPYCLVTLVSVVDLNGQLY